MAIVRDVYHWMDQIAPFSMQEGFDNAGFLVGHAEANVEGILVALDITPWVVEEALDRHCSLIVSHHPVIFHPQKALTDESVTGRILLRMAEENIAAICAHTNLDAAAGGVNDCLAQALSLQQAVPLVPGETMPDGTPCGIGRIGLAHAEGLAPEAYAAFVKERLGAASVRYVDGGSPVHRVAVGGGSCGSMLQEARVAGCDTFVTADVKYDQYLEAKALGISIMDAGHYATEQVVCAPLAEQLRAAFPEIPVYLTQTHQEVYGAV